jgi:hypothetical protein
VSGRSTDTRVRLALTIIAGVAAVAACGTTASSPGGSADGGPTLVAVTPIPVTPVPVTAAPTAVPATPEPTAPVLCTSTPAGLVAWWPGEGTADDAVGTNDGSPENGVGFVPGKIGLAFSFDGVDDVVRVPNDPSLDPDGSFSFSAWILPGEFVGEVGLLEKWGDASDWAGNRAYDLAIFDDGRIRFGLADGQQQSNGLFHVLDSPAGVAPAAAWRNIAWVYDQPTGTRRIYADGLLVTERADTPRQPFVSKADLSFGAIARASDLVAFFYAGLIDEIRYFDRALTADEVQGSFEAESAGSCSPAA